MELVVVTEERLIVIVDDDTGESVEVTFAGDTLVEVMEMGIAGPAGIGASTYQLDQTTPLSTWVMNHNLGFRPTVSVYSVGGVEVEAGVLHVSLNQCLINFAAPQVGSAIAR